MDLLWTDSDGSEAIDVPAQVKALEQKSQATVPVVLVAHGVWPKSPSPRKHPPVDQVIRSPKKPWSRGKLSTPRFTARERAAVRGIQWTPSSGAERSSQPHTDGIDRR